MSDEDRCPHGEPYHQGWRCSFVYCDVCAAGPMTCPECGAPDRSTTVLEAHLAPGEFVITKKAAKAWRSRTALDEGHDA